ncbi:M23 family metallopeptidase [Sinomicrobium soli]|uniref:M23 family metallopeptidase n=1 Tax=Sinomicrobium sp. N-1-3-6 TaxID=2219864 RepID=UPI000DCD543B|nr:M23 family metallopeptidase [Sinomicrobium sp. N-1-3-6]RAV27510.1 M23 family peptidase [Sinomicrobium sp. N-1-3-6]
MRLFHFALAFLVISASFAQQQAYPDDYFRAPLDIPLLTSGTFGELRGSHFHAGTDLKTQQREGLKAYAAADGYISAIKISPWGYGKVLYITHPNGYTTVYAHLKKFNTVIEAYVKKQQYEKESFSIEISPDASELPVKKGDVIAYTGNTGSSGGPHLHFEIRDTETEKPINPFFFGLKVKDTQAPVIQGLYAYSLSDSTRVNQSQHPLPIRFSRQPDGTLLADGITAFGDIGFGIRTYDRQDLSYNKNGAYSVQLSVNGNARLSYDFRTFSFAETRYIKTMIDYSHYVRQRQIVQKCFIDTGNRLSIYGRQHQNGIIHIEEGSQYNVLIEVSDFEGNSSTLQIPVSGKKEDIRQPVKKEITPYHLRKNRDNIYTIGKNTVFFPANSSYGDLYLDLEDLGNGSCRVHHPEIPLHDNYTLTMDVSEYPEGERKQLFIAHTDSRGRPAYRKTYKRGNSFSTHTRDLGVFSIVKDSTPPRVTPVNFKNKQWLSNYHSLKIKITDDLSGIDTYRATINGKWILMEYEPKQNMLTYDFEDMSFDESKQQLEVVVTDNVGNSTTFNATFYRAKKTKNPGARP